MIKKNHNLKSSICGCRRGMTYIELIVVLSIFFTMSLVVLFDYGKFQENIDIKILANDIASKIVDAQKSSLSGKLPARFYDFSSWKPSYGIYFNTYTLSDKTSFIYFTDLDLSGDFDTFSGCPGVNGSADECIDKILITNGNYISKIEKYAGGVSSTINDPLSIVFKRPDSGVFFKSNGLLLTDFDYMVITVSSPSGLNANIKVYPSGRIQIN